MDPAPSLGCSLKDVKWSSVAVPLDLLVSTYRLPQIARLDSGESRPGAGQRGADRDLAPGERACACAREGGIGGEWWAERAPHAPRARVGPRGCRSPGALFPIPAPSQPQPNSSKPERWKSEPLQRN
jgi:hypothetical protein